MYTHINPNSKKLKFSDQIGRSIIEMLGVLAIIGVLSIGGIAGYSKAMFKYRLNKQIEQISSILDTIYTNGDKLENKAFSAGDFFNAINILEWVPAEMIPRACCAYKDALNNSVIIKLNKSSSTTNPHTYVEMRVQIAEAPYEVCISLFKIAQSRSLYISNIIFQPPTGLTNYRYGDDLCTSKREKNKECIKQINIAEMSKLCSICRGTSSCNFYYIWNVRYL